MREKEKKLGATYINLADYVSPDPLGVNAEVCALAKRLNATPQPLRPTSYTLHPNTLHPRPYTLNPKLYTLHPTPYTLHPTPYTLCRGLGTWLGSRL